MELKNLKINFLGDSITAGHGASDIKTKGYVGLIASKTGAVCRNYGIGGTTIAPITMDVPDDIWKQDFCKRADGMDPDADCVIIFGGTNDFGHGDGNFGKLGDKDKVSFYGCLDYLFKSIIEKYPNSKIGIITPLHREGENGKSNHWDRSVGLYDIVNAIREVAEYYSLPVLDLFKESGLQPKVPAIKEKYMPDGLHPNDAGYEILAEKVIKFIESL